MVSKVSEGELIYNSDIDRGVSQSVVTCCEFRDSQRVYITEPETGGSV